MSRVVLFACVALVSSGCGGVKVKDSKEEAKDNAEKKDGHPKLLGKLNDPSTGNPLLRSKSRADQMMLQNNLKQVMMAMQSYHDVNRSFPPSGEGRLSWRVHLLPYMEQRNLYDQFKLDEPWDSEHNKKLIGQMPAVYKTTSADDLTSLMVFTGNGAFYDGGKPPTIHVLDGTSNTIAVIVAGGDKAAPWTKPTDIPFNPSNPYSELGDIGTTLVYATVDGAVYIRGKDEVSAETLKALATKSGGEAVRLP